MLASGNTPIDGQQPYRALAAQQSDPQADSGALLSALWRGKFIIALIAGIAIIAGGYYAYVAATPMFRSTAVVILETDQGNIVDLQSVATGISGDSTEVNSEVEVLRARSLMGKVVDRLSLIEDPEFNVGLQTPSRFDTAFESLKTVVKDVLGETRVPEPTTPEQKRERNRDAVITTLLQSVNVRNVPQSLVFQVTVETTQARKSALIAQTIVELYILNQIEVKFEATEQATLWLSERVADLQNKLEQAEAEVAEFSASTELVSVEGMQALERQLKDLRDRIGQTQSDYESSSVEVAALAAAATRAEQSALANDAQLTRLLSMADEDPTVVPVFEARLATIIDRQNIDLLRTEQQLIALRASEAELTEKLDAQGEDLIALQQLTREAEASRVLYEYFLTRFNETAVQQGIQQADSRILSSAVVPRFPAEPRKSLILVMSGVLGAMLGIGLVLLRELRSSGFRTGNDLEQATGYTVLGQIPQMPVSSRRGAVQYLASKPTSVAAEAYRNLRTSIMLAQIDNPPQVILVTSSLPGEGKTTNSIALAHNLVGLGKKVLLVEGDIRRRTLDQYFKGSSKRGIISVLKGEAELADAVFQSPGFGADILSGEKTNANAADVFSSAAFAELIEKTRQSYDTIIIDTPPVLVVPDARIIAQQADAVLFTVKWDSTSRQQVEESMRLFQNSGQRITGFILGQISPKGMKRYGYGGKYGAYSGYNSKYYSN